MTACWQHEIRQDSCFACAFSLVTNLTVACWGEMRVFLALALLWSRDTFFLGSALGLCHAGREGEQEEVCRGWDGERLTEFMQRHKQEMTLFGERVSLWVGTSSNYPPFSAELTSNYCYSLIKVCKLKIYYFFFSPDWVKYRYSQLTKVFNIILVRHWKGSVNKRRPNKKSSEPGQSWVRAYKTCSERVRGSGGLYNYTNRLQPEFSWSHLPAGAAAEIRGWG